MAKRLSENEKEEIARSFSKGKTIQELSEEFKCTKLTISRNLKKSLGEEKYCELIKIAKKDKITPRAKQISNESFSNINEPSDSYNKELFEESPFFELAPLDSDIDNFSEKDLSSNFLN